MNQNIRLCSKNEIIDHVIKVSEYLAKNQLGNMRKSMNTWKTYKKEDLIDIYMKMLAVIGADMRQRALQDPDAVPELKELVLEYNAKVDAIRNKMREIRDDYANSIKLILNTWLGHDLQYSISTSNIGIHIPNPEGSKRSGLDITIYYRDNVDWVNHEYMFGKGELEINQPTFGTWNPKCPEDQDAVRFFKVLYTLATDTTGRLDNIREYMDKCFEKATRYGFEVDDLKKQFVEDAAAITGEITMNMEF